MIDAWHTRLPAELLHSPSTMSLSNAAFRLLVIFAEAWARETGDGKRDCQGIVFSWGHFCDWKMTRKTWQIARDELELHGFIYCVFRDAGIFSSSENWRNYDENRVSKNYSGGVKTTQGGCVKITQGGESFLPRGVSKNYSGGRVKITHHIKNKEYTNELFNEVCAGVDDSITFACLGTPAEWKLDEKLLSTLKTAYPLLDVKAEVKRAWAWCEANQAKRKTAKGMPKFINAWMARADEKPKQGRGPHNGIKMPINAADLEDIF